jgi:hypothetical protein
MPWLTLDASLLCSPGIFISEGDGMLAHGTPAVPDKADMITRLAVTGLRAQVPRSALFGRFVGICDVSHETTPKTVACGAIATDCQPKENAK